MPETIVDNTAAPVVDNGSAQAAAAGLEAGRIDPNRGAAWKERIANADVRNSLSKFDDTPEGIGKLAESYNNLEQLLGRDKVPIPKDINDVEGWNRLSKALGVPDKAEGYGLADASIPADLAQMGLTLNKNEFAEVMHAHKVPPGAVKGIWDVYQQKAIGAYKQAMVKQKEQLTNTVNTLRGEWGDSYDTNVELGQMVINKFSDSKETNDKITALLSRDPAGIKFLAKVGEQFAENKVPEFQMKRFSLAPEEALEEVTKIKMDMDGPYMNSKGRWTPKEHDAAVDRVNHLLGVYQKGRQG
jgi:hypothetical protein